MAGVIFNSSEAKILHLNFLYANFLKTYTKFKKAVSFGLLLKSNIFYFWRDV